MLRAIQKRLKNKKGFTLVELIVVIAILGVLSAIVVPKFSGMQDKAKEEVDAANIKLIQHAVELYEAQKGDYPDDTSDINTLINTYLNGESPTVQNGGGVFIINVDTGTVDIGTADDDNLKVTKTTTP